MLCVSVSTYNVQHMKIFVPCMHTEPGVCPMYSTCIVTYTFTASMYLTWLELYNWYSLLRREVEHQNGYSLKGWRYDRPILSLQLHVVFY